MKYGSNRGGTSRKTRAEEVTACGFKFGETWCEIHVIATDGVYVARLFEVEMQARTIRVLGPEIGASDEAGAIAQACKYLAGRYGPQGEAFVPAPLDGRTLRTELPKSL